MSDLTRPIIVAATGRATGTTTGTATARMTRVLFGGTALTGIAFALLALQTTFEQAQFLNPIWSAAVTSALWALPLVIIAMASWAPLSWLRACAFVLIAVYCAAMITWPLAQRVDRIPDGDQPWIINLLSMTVFASALVLPEAAAGVFLVVACVGAGVLRYVADGSRSMALPIQDTLFNSMTVLVFVAIIIVTLRAGRQRDETALQTAADAVATAASEARSAERAYVAALTHDDVISTLLAAGRATDATAPLVRGAATRALARLDDLSASESDAAGLIPASALATELRQTVTAISPQATLLTPDDPAGLLPISAVRALNDATAEALRNSLRHADTGLRATRRIVEMVTTSDVVTVTVKDDGAGFDIDNVPLERYGIRLSITHRMALVPGGSSTISSTPGGGTIVALTWQRYA